MNIRQFLFVAALTAVCSADSAQPVEEKKPDRRVAGQKPAEMVLVEPNQITPKAAADWQKEGFTSVVLVLDEKFDRENYLAAAKAVAAGSLALYYWIEIGRNPKMAGEHPRWMASLGMHGDWMKRFPGAPKPGQDEVAKAFPWVPINYREAFEAHLERVKALLDRAAGPYRGLLLDDLQGGPSSCGCGNLQCRWATDYQVPTTGQKLEGDNAAAKFVTAVGRVVAGKQVIPVWTSECEDIDLPANKRSAGKTTGLCGTVGCNVGSCPKEFAKQWSALLAGHQGPVGVLGLHQEFERTRGELAVGTQWPARAMDYVDSTSAANRGETAWRQRTWLVVQGYDVTPGEESAARQAARQSGVGAVVVARTRINQSYEPKIVKVK